MRILLLTQFYWPESADYKNHVLAKELAWRGHEVTVVTTFPNHPTGKIFDGYKQTWRQWESRDGYKVLRVPVYPDHSQSGLKRAMNYLSFTLSAATTGFVLSGRQETVLVHATPITLGLVAGLYKLFYNSQIILDVLDLWPDAIASSRIGTNFQTEIAGWLAQKAYRIADRINVPTVGFLDALQQRGVPAEKISLVPIWGDSSVFFETDRSKEFGLRYNLNGKFCIVYTGNIGLMQDIKNIITAADYVRDIECLRFVFVGAGSELENLKNYAESLRLSNVIFTGAYPKQEMPGIMAWANALLVSLQSDPYLAINFPSKIPGYLSAGRPILVCGEGEAKRIVEQNRLGFTCRPGNPAEFAKMVRSFLSIPEPIKSEIGQKCKTVFRTTYNKDIIIDQYTRMIENDICFQNDPAQ